MIRPNLIALSALVIVTTSVRADAVSDASAGLQALNQGDAKTAIRLFTRAIEGGTLSHDDLEYAYVERGNAYLLESAPDHARRDADEALRLKAGDRDAVALWKNTTIEAAPGKPEKPSLTTIVYSCAHLPVTAKTHYIDFEIDTEGHFVRSHFGESGRKLDIQVTDAAISWHEHEEGINNSEVYGDQDLSIDKSTGVMTNNYQTSVGARGTTQYSCHVVG
jgi:tetratricopeptide (TPR) repeat protein